MTKTEQHRATFSLRSDLADAIREYIAEDASIEFDTGYDPADFCSEFAEHLIVAGWVFQYPGEEGEEPA